MLYARNFPIERDIARSGKLIPQTEFVRSYKSDTAKIVEIVKSTIVSILYFPFRNR